MSDSVLFIFYILVVQFKSSFLCFQKVIENFEVALRNYPTTSVPLFLNDSSWLDQHRVEDGGRVCTAEMQYLRTFQQVCEKYFCRNLTIHPWVRFIYCKLVPVFVCMLLVCKSKKIIVLRFISCHHFYSLQPHLGWKEIKSCSSKNWCRVAWRFLSRVEKWKVTGCILLFWNDLGITLRCLLTTKPVLSLALKR